MSAKMNPLRRRMVEDMRIRGIGDAQRRSHIRGVALFAAFLGRSPDTATAEDLRAWQVRLEEDNVTASIFNTRLRALRFFFEITWTPAKTYRFRAWHDSLPGTDREGWRCGRRVCLGFRTILSV